MATAKAQSRSSQTRPKSITRYRGLTPREVRVVQRVRKHLHAILPNGEIKSLILYGSRVRGDARPDSDIDLFLVYDHVTPEQEASLKEFTTELLSKEPTVHVMEYRADELAHKNGISPLIYNASHHGILLQGAPVPKLEINRRQVASDLIAKAQKNLIAAQVLLDAEIYNNAISDAYYAVLYAADAALATKGFVAQSHTVTETLVGAHFIRRGLIPAEFKGLIGRARKARVKADYGREVQFTRDDAVYWLARAKEFVAFVASSIPKWLEE